MSLLTVILPAAGKGTKLNGYKDLGTWEEIRRLTRDTG